MLTCCKIKYGFLSVAKFNISDFLLFKMTTYLINSL